jgi:hypothetical protein
MGVKINPTKDRVKLLLEHNEHLRDSDDKLVASIWLIDINKLRYNAKDLNSFDFMKLYSEGKLTSADSITRCRRKLQEEHVHLRGETYKERQGKQNKVIEDLNKN